MRFTAATVLISALTLARAFVLDKNSVQFIDGESSSSNETIIVSLPQQPTGDVIAEISALEGVFVQPCKVKFTKEDWRNKQITVTPAFMWNSTVKNQTMASSISISIFETSDNKFRNLSSNVSVTRRLKLAPVCQSTGDPHILTADGQRFSPQTIGTFTLLNSPDVLIQTRTYKCGRQVSCNDGLAIQYKNFKQVFTLGEGNAKGILNASSEIIGLRYTNDSITFPNGISIRTQVVTDFNSALAVKGYLDVYVTIPGNYFKSIDGMCGTFNGRIEDDSTTATVATCDLFEQDKTCSLLVVNQPEKPKCIDIPFTSTTTSTSTTTTSTSTTTSISSTTSLITTSTSTQAIVTTTTESAPATTTTTTTSTQTSLTVETTSTSTSTSTESVTYPPSTTSTQRPTETPTNPECPEITYTFAKSYCARIFSQFQVTYENADVFIENCAYDAVVMCDVERCAANTFRSLQVRVEVHANVMIQSSDPKTCDEGKKLIDTYVTPMKSDDGKSGETYNVNEKGEKVCKSGYTGINCNINLKEVFDTVISELSAGEKVAASAMFLLTMHLLLL